MSSKNVPTPSSSYYLLYMIRAYDGIMNTELVWGWNFLGAYVPFFSYFLVFLLLRAVKADEQTDCNLSLFDEISFLSPDLVEERTTDKLQSVYSLSA